LRGNEYGIGRQAVADCLLWTPAGHRLFHLFQLLYGRLTSGAGKLIRIFRKRDSAIRPLGAVLLERHEQWTTSHRHLDMATYCHWRACETGERQGLEGDQLTTTCSGFIEGALGV
jgi:hypothetical protein